MTTCEVISSVKLYIAKADIATTFVTRLHVVQKSVITDSVIIQSAIARTILLTRLDLSQSFLISTEETEWYHSCR